MFDIWARLLAAVPGSVLWLLDCSSYAQANLRREAAARGLVPDRLVFAPFLDMEEHRRRYACADLFLDTWPCNAHTTAAEALWMDLPVLTLPGRSFASRVAASLLHELGLEEMIASSPAHYEETALKLASDTAGLAEIRAKLAQNRLSASMYDPARLCRQLESAYEAMHVRHLTGAVPNDFRVQVS